MSGWPGLLAQGAGVSWTSPLTWAVVLISVGVIPITPPIGRGGRVIGGGLLLVGLGLLLAGLQPLGLGLVTGVAEAAQLTAMVVFYVLLLITVASAVATISSQSPVYSAVWFAVCLLGVAGLFLFQGAQFLGVATIVVYAGAILVTFLFVLMLAQPEGETQYDRVSWGGATKPLSAAVTATLLTAVVGVFTRYPLPAAAARNSDSAEASHMVQLGRPLFEQHLVSVEVAGTLLLVALVGAVAIIVHGKNQADAGGRA